MILAAQVSIKVKGACQSCALIFLFFITFCPLFEVGFTYSKKSLYDISINGGNNAINQFPRTITHVC